VTNTMREPIPPGGYTWNVPGIVGVLGGMGPLATVDFLRKVIAHTPSGKDQDHVSLIVASIPQIPDRTAAFLGRGECPLEALTSCAHRLVDAGAQLIVMPCNTAHLWYRAVQATLATPFLNIVDVTLGEIVNRVGCNAAVGLLATEATVQSQLYSRRSTSTATGPGLRWVLPTKDEQRQWVNAAIAAVKSGDTAIASEYGKAAANALLDRGADCLVMACTEIPLILTQADVTRALIDPTDVLARETFRWWKSHRVMIVDADRLPPANQPVLQSLPSQ
jgi:aspartate racemase